MHMLSSNLICIPLSIMKFMIRNIRSILFYNLDKILKFLYILRFEEREREINQLNSIIIFQQAKTLI